MAQITHRARSSPAGCFKGGQMLFSVVLALFLQTSVGENSLEPDQGELVRREPRDPSVLPGIDIGGLTIETGGSFIWAKTPAAFGFLRDRSIPNGLTVRRFDYRYLSDHSPFQFRFKGVDLGQHDMGWDVELEVSNRFRTHVEFAGFTHFWGRGGRTLLTEVSPGLLV